MSVALQHLDQDIYFNQWSPPPGLIDKNRLPGAPQHGIGRPCKVGKEEIVGLLTALRRFVAEPESERYEKWRSVTSELCSALQDIPGTVVEELADSRSSHVPMVQLTLDERELGCSALDLVIRLQDGHPSIHANPSKASEGVILFGPMCLKSGEPSTIGDTVRDLLRSVR